MGRSLAPSDSRSRGGRSASREPSRWAASSLTSALDFRVRYCAASFALCTGVTLVATRHLAAPDLDARFSALPAAVHLAPCLSFAAS